MTPIYDLNQFSNTPSVDEDHDHDQTNLHPFPLPVDYHADSLSCPIFFNPSQIRGTNDTDQHAQQQQQFTDRFVIQGSSDFQASFPTNNTNKTAEGYMCDQHVVGKEPHQAKSSKWMSSKMRIMKKMMNQDHEIATKKPRRSKLLLQEPQRGGGSGSGGNSPSDGIVRVCSDCSTTKTPLWRSGPSGPKSLCNACGIRQRKARRALAAAAAVSGALIPKIAPNNNIQADKGSLGVAEHTVPFKKRCRFSTAGGGAQKKLGSFDDIVISLSKSSSFHRVFPQDEKDAAILLMALSCGLMCS